MVRRDKFYWLLILAIIMVPLVALGENPGLYYDSIIVDYGSLQLLNPQEHFETRMFAYPILVQLYHGSINFFISLLVILITGRTSVLQHHMVNGLIIFVALIILDYIFDRHMINTKLRHICIVLLAFLPTITTFSLTQYYIELPGIVCILAATYIFDKASTDYKSDRSYLLFGVSFILLGIAFYSYFNFLFFFLGFILIYVFQGKEIIEKIRNFLVGCYGFACGSVLYFAGYLMIYLNRVGKGSLSNIFAVGLVIAVFIVAGIVYRHISKGNIKVPMIVSCIVVIIGILCLVKGYTVIGTLTESLHISGTETNLLERLYLLWQNTNWAISGLSAEILIYSSVKTKFQGVYLLLFISVTVLYFVGIFHNKCSIKIRSEICKYIFILLTYLICCLVFASRMHTQHFVPLVFWMFMILVMEINEIGQWLIQKEKVKKISISLGYVMALMLLVLNTINRYKVINHCLYTGGTLYYTNQINKLADEAITNAQSGMKEIYVFPEWGFMTGFCYLTQNRIAFSTYADSDSLQQYLGEDYEIAIVYWTESDTAQYVNELNSLNCKNIEQREYIQNNGEVAFYKINASWE